MKSMFFAAVIGIVLAIVGVAVCSADGVVIPEIPMTHDQVVAFVQGKGIDWAAAWIADVYLATPVPIMPGLTGISHGTDFTASLDGLMVLSISDKLKYNIAMGPWTFKGAVPQIDTWALVKAGGIGFLVGVAVTVTTLALTGHFK